MKRLKDYLVGLGYGALIGLSMGMVYFGGYVRGGHDEASECRPAAVSR